MAPIHGCDEDNNSTIISALDMKHSSDAPNMPPASPPLTSSGGVVINVQHADSKKSPQYSPTNMSDEDNYECYGDGVQLELESNGSLSVSGDSSEHRPPNSINRHTWCRTSLRRSPKSNQDNLPNRRWGSFRHSGKRQLGSNALASQLYRSSSFNSSGRSSTCDTADDMYSDVSLEEDVLDLNHKVQLLQQQVNVLADSANTTDDRYVRVKADNAALQARVHMLEEQLREVELRAEERMQDEQRRQREIMVRVEREKQLQLENASIRLQTLELEVASLRDEISRERAIVKSLRDERNEAAQRALEAETLLKENSDELQVTKETIRRHKQEYESAKHIIEELSKELELCRLEKSNSEISNIPPIDTGHLEELQAELDSLRMDNRSLKNMNEELQEALLTRSVEEGKSLLVGTEESLAAEFEAMSHDQMQQALKEQQDVNTHLRLYIDNILLNIVENYPQLLEVKHLPT